MTLFEWFVVVFLGTWLLEYVSRALINLYLEIKKMLKESNHHEKY